MSDEWNSDGTAPYVMMEAAIALDGLFMALDTLDLSADREAVRGIILAGRPLAMKHMDDVQAWYDHINR